MKPTLVWNVRRSAYALCLAAASVGVLAARVELGVERIRHRVVTAPVSAAGTTLIVQLPELPRLAGTRAAVVARLRGPGAAAARIVVSLDGEPVAETTIPASRERRVDWSFVVPSGPGHQVALTGDLAGWTLLYLEIANVHGFSRGIIDFAIVPGSRPRVPVAPGWLLALAGLGALALAPRRDWPRPGPIRILHRIACAAVLAAFAAAVATEWVSRFAIVLSLHTFVLGAAVLYAEPLARVWRGLRRVRRLRKASLLLPHLVLTAMFIWCIAGFYDPATGFTSFVQFGQEFGSRALPVLSDVPHATEPGWGYDGQFYAQLALDPLLRSEALRVALDSPEYRGRRVLLPAMAWVLGLGRPGLVLQAFSLLNVASWIVLAWLLLRWLPAGSGRTLAAWAACLFSPGLLASVRSALPDGPSVLLLVVGLIAVERHRPWLAGLVLGVSGLGRETNLLGGTMLLPSPWHREDLARLAGRAIVMLLPLGLWVAYLKTRGLPPDLSGARNFGWPLAAYVEKWVSTIGAIRQGADHYVWFSLLSGAALTAQAAVLAAYRNWSSPWWRLGAAYALFGLVLGPAVWEGHPGAAPRVLLPMTIAFNVLLPGSRLFWPLWILGNLALVHGLEAIRVPWL